MSALEKVLRWPVGSAPAEEDPNAAWCWPCPRRWPALACTWPALTQTMTGTTTRRQGDDDGDADDIENSATYKALIKKGVAPKLARAMALKAAKKVAATALAESACVILAGLTEPEAEPGTGADLPWPGGRAGRPARGERVGAPGMAKQGQGIAGWQLPDAGYEACALRRGARRLQARDWKAAMRLIRKLAKSWAWSCPPCPGSAESRRWPRPWSRWPPSAMQRPRRWPMRRSTVCMPTRTCITGTTCTAGPPTGWQRWPVVRERFAR